MAPSPIYRKSRVCFAILEVACLVSAACEKKAEAQRAAESEAEGLPSDPTLVGVPSLPGSVDTTPVSNPVDTMVDMLPQVQWFPESEQARQELQQRQQKLVQNAEKVEYKAGNMDAEIATIRQALIQQRLEDLEKKADEQDWDLDPPAAGDPEQKLDQERKFIKKNLRVLKKGALPSAVRKAPRDDCPPPAWKL